MIPKVSLGELTCLSLEIDYIKNPIHFYKEFGKKANSLLLMTTEIDSKKKQKSMIVLDSSVKIVALKEMVKIIPLNANGNNFLRFFGETISTNYEIKQTDESIEIRSKKASKILDEDKRLKRIGPFSVIREILEKVTCLGKRDDLFIGGNFSFDLIETFEQLPEVAEGPTSCPYYTLYIAETLVEIDHVTHKSKVKKCLFGGEKFEQNYHDSSRELSVIQEQIEKFENIESDLTVKDDLSGMIYDPSISDEDFANHVLNIKEKIIEGDIFQAVVSRVFKTPCSDSLKAFEYLIELNPSPYMFYMKDEEFELFGASPESAVKFNSENRRVEVYPIAGTRRRGFDKNGDIDLDMDGRIETELRMDEKEVAEHVMLVDLARNDVAKISDPGTRFVAPLMKVDRYSRVMHLVSQVNGTLREDLDALHAYQATMNMGTLTGAPKISAATILRNIEKVDRGPYGGAVGYINGKGDFDSCIVIRSAIVKENTAYVQAGAGVVYDSDAMAETTESKDKAHSVLKAIQLSREEYV